MTMVRSQLHNRHLHLHCEHSVRIKCYSFPLSLDYFFFVHAKIQRYMVSKFTTENKMKRKSFYSFAHSKKRTNLLQMNWIATSLQILNNRAHGHSVCPQFIVDTVLNNFKNDAQQFRCCCIKWTAWAKFFIWIGLLLSANVINFMVRHYDRFSFAIFLLEHSFYACIRAGKVKYQSVLYLIVNFSHANSISW